MQPVADDGEGERHQIGRGSDSMLPSSPVAEESDTRVPTVGSESPAPTEAILRCNDYNPYMPGAKPMLPTKGPLEATFAVNELDTECPICLKTVLPRVSDLYLGHCCTQLYHAGCWARSAWGQLRQEADTSRNFRCPRCSIPPTARRVQETIRQEMLEMLRGDTAGGSSDEEVSNLPQAPAKLSAEERAKRDLLRDDDDEEEQEVGVREGRWARAKMTIAGAGILGTRAALSELRTGGKKVDLHWIRESGMKIDDLLNQFSVRDLFEHGVTKWKYLRELGFKRDHLRTLANMGQIPQLVAYYHVEAPLIRRDLGMTVKDIAGLQLSATVMGQLGFNAHQLCIMGLTKDHIKSFQGIPMGEWIQKLGLSPFHLMLLKFKDKDFRPGYLDYSWNVTSMAKMMRMDLGTASRLNLTIAEPRVRAVPGRRRPRELPTGRRRRRYGRRHF